MTLCACGCQRPLPPDRWRNRPRYLRGHYEVSVAGKQSQSRGGRAARGDAKRRRKAAA